MSDPVHGLLTSQIGYDADAPVRVVYRAPDAGALPADATLSVSSAGGATRQVALRPWGGCWGAHWWTAEVGVLAPGTWRVELAGAQREQAEIDVAPHRLWRASWQAVALEQLERRTRIAWAGHGTGWQDCGVNWQEVNSHAACIVGLCDLLMVAGAQLDAEQRRRVVAQIEIGVRLLNRLQDAGPKAGLAAGALVHEELRGIKPLPRDALWAALAWAKAAHATGGTAAADWRARALAALRWWTAQPVDHTGMDPVAHSWRPGYVPPAELAVGTLALAAWAWSELAERADDEAGRAAIGYAARVVERQIADAGKGPYGHFWEFSDRAHPAMVWTHNGIGPDTGDSGLPPALVLAFLLRRWGGHADAARWRAALVRHVDGWVLPSAAASPFGIAARGWQDGWIHFSGLWHGMNAAYGLQAVLCDELAGLLGRPELRAVATANRQWIAGLNCGITCAARAQGCHMTWPATEPGRALPAAMIVGVGRRWIGGWMGIPGSIANGFGSGDQFRFDVPADPRSDAPTAYTDEEWIVHAGAWMMAVARVAG